MKTKKFLTCVTMTGADDTVSVADLRRLQKRFQYAEFGILLSDRHSHFGSARFPSRHWLKQLVAVAMDEATPLRLSGHICGKWVRDALLGKWPKLDDVADNLSVVFQRFQLNTHAEPHMWHLGHLSSCVDRLQDECQTVIFQLDGNSGSTLAGDMVGYENVAGLFDLSHGRGVAPEQWPQPVAGLKCGYAGGLSPENVAEHLSRIQEVAGDGAWIDAETHLRRSDGFDLERAEAFLEAARPWVVEKD